MNGNLIALVLLLFLSLLNFEYGTLITFDLESNDYLRIILILICICGILYELKGRKKQMKTEANKR